MVLPRKETQLQNSSRQKRRIFLCCPVVVRSFSYDILKIKGETLVQSQTIEYNLLVLWQCIVTKLQGIVSTTMQSEVQLVDESMNDDVAKRTSFYQVKHN